MTNSREDAIQRALASPAVRQFLNWREREARPRIACADCQFEYVAEDGHECREGT